MKRFLFHIWQISVEEMKTRRTVFSIHTGIILVKSLFSGQRRAKLNRQKFVQKTVILWGCCTNS